MLNYSLLTLRSGRLFCAYAGRMAALFHAQIPVQMSDAESPPSAHAVTRATQITRARDTELHPSAGQRRNWNELPTSSASLAAIDAASTHPGLTLLICPSTAAARETTRECRVFAPAGLEVLHFPDWETLPYDAFSPHQDIISERLETMARLPALTRGLVIVTLGTALQRTSPRGYVSGSSFHLAPGMKLDLELQRRTLVDAGYRAVSAVTERGEFAVRGALLDIFPMGAPEPIRIDLLDDEIDTLRTFDPDTQRSTERLERLDLLPAHEFPVEGDAIKAFRRRWHERFDVDQRKCPVYQDVSQGIMPSGIEYYLPLFFDELGSLFDYLPENTLALHLQPMEESAQAVLDAVEARYENLRYDIERPILSPAELYLSHEELLAKLAPFAKIGFNQRHKHEEDFGAAPLPNLTADIRARTPAAALTDYFAAHPQPVVFVAESAGRRELVDEFLRRAEIETVFIDDWNSYRGLLEAGTAPRFAMLVAMLTRGVTTPSFSLITEADIYGRRATPEERENRQRIDSDQIVRNLNELHIGAPVVHIDHGVGRYQGLTTLSVNDSVNEFLQLEYADESKLYVPVASLHLISRYSGSDENGAPLHRLGSDQWEKARRKAAEKAFDVAAELLNLYALRKSRPAFQFDVPEEDYRIFSEQFEFTTTADQAMTIDAVVADMTSASPMDRLVCGDVGFGKTEVAMRAAFLAVQNGKQVGVLVPTTLLAQQHGESFRDRFADWPVRVEVISRLRADSEVKTAMEDTANGKVDILIGTHKLLSKSLKFANLGLVIVDEEHRFGVRQKERLKAMRAEVDLLTLTATPIPRTLNMAIGGIRDLSIIATPPAKRLSIKTFIQEKRNHLIREALSRELMRGGQVFYVHNEVRTIEQAAADIGELVPEARIAVGHGQMAKRELETVMNDFQHRRCNVLVCSTIIETGIDIPNANTIIIDRADKFGLAQLHQLRGRVGRSDRQAYAYLLTPHQNSLSADAKKRLEAIEASGDLGIGFTLATHDMEIRGAGEMLGDGQSGQIEEVGFSLYMEMLERAVQAIRDGKTPNMDQPFETSQEINLHQPALIPADYMGDVHARLITYKRISNATTEDQLDDLRAELIDRFGSLPPQLETLFTVTHIKLLATPLGIARIDLGENGGKVVFQATTEVDPMAIVKLVQTSAGVWKMEGATTLRARTELPELTDRVELCTGLIARLGRKPDTK